VENIVEVVSSCQC